MQNTQLIDRPDFPGKFLGAEEKKLYNVVLIFLKPRLWMQIMAARDQVESPARASDVIHFSGMYYHWSATGMN